LDSTTLSARQISNFKSQIPNSNYPRNSSNNTGNAER
jgi:hypothetical protein